MQRTGVRAIEPLVWLLPDITLEALDWFDSMDTPAISIICFAVAALVGAIGQFLYKNGSAAANGGWASYFNIQLLGGVVCYIAVMVLFVVAFKRGGSLTVLYPIYASTFIWAAMIAWKTEGTPITATNLGGMLLLIAGMYLMGKQS